MSEALLEVEHVGVRLGGRAILEDVSLEVAADELVTIIGPNGAGKTTLIRVILGLIRPDRGRVRRAAGATLAYLPQRLHVDATLPLTVGAFLDLPRRHDRTVRAAALAETGVPEVADTPLQGLSGGQFQRVLLARALLREPRLLILDEPAQNVDPGGQIDLFRLIERTRERLGCGVLTVSHDLHLVMATTDRVICLNGHVCCTGRPEAVGRDPAFRALFGRGEAAALAPYRHHHDHAHAVDGTAVPAEPA